MIKLVVGSSSSGPVYRQLYEQIRSQIVSGALVGGECLPSIRRVANELCISVITVKTAYEMLAKDGYVESSQGKGVFVKNPLSPDESRKKIAEERLSSEIKFYKNLGLSRDQFIDLVQKIY